MSTMTWEQQREYLLAYALDARDSMGLKLLHEAITAAVQRADACRGTPGVDTFMIVSVAESRETPIPARVRAVVESALIADAPSVVVNQERDDEGHVYATVRFRAVDR